jgi:ribosomal-protein-alanine N-acetyltransferase
MRRWFIRDSSFLEVVDDNPRQHLDVGAIGLGAAVVKGHLAARGGIMTSERLAYQPVSLPALDMFHSLVEDPHVRRYLMDGQIYPREWSEARVLASQDLFDRRGVGLWLVHERPSHELVGFCGFMEIPMLHPEPQLVYALFERYTGRGYATEMARTAIEEARRHAGFDTIVAGVDEVNVASARVLEKLGFRRTSVHRGILGNSYLLVLETAPGDTKTG